MAEAEKTPAEKEKDRVQAERDSIDVTNNKPTEVKEPEEEAEIKEETKEKKIIEANEEEVEELEEEKKEAKSDKDKERIQKRIDKLTAKNKELEKALATAQAALAAKPDDEKVFTEEEIEKRAEVKARQLKATEEFNASVNRIAKSCEKLDKDFSAKVNAMVEDITGPNTYLPSVMVGILDDLEQNGGPVLMHLAANPDEYEEIHSLSPARMALKLKELEGKLIVKERREKAKEISKVPEVKDKVAGKGTTPEQRASEKDTMQDFVRKRNAEVEARRREKAGLH